MRSRSGRAPLRALRRAVAAGVAVAAAVAAALAVTWGGGDGLESAEGAVRHGDPGVAVAFRDVARERGLAFHHGAFRFGVSADPAAMVGGGLCWLDADDDGWLDLFVVNGYAESDRAGWRDRGGLPTSRLFRNERGRFVDVSRGSGANVSLRGSGCVAADLNGDGHTDLYVTADGYDALLWNRGDGTFVEGARAAGITTFSVMCPTTSSIITNTGRR